MTRTRTNSNAVFLLLAIVCIIIGFLSMTLPPLSEHAFSKHDSDALTAYKIVEQHGNDYNCFECKDGRTRYVCPAPNNLYAVVVMVPEKVITAFLCRQEYAKTITEMGSNPFRDVIHP